MGNGGAVPFFPSSASPSGLAESEKEKGGIHFSRRKTLLRVKLKASFWRKENYSEERQPDAL